MSLPDSLSPHPVFTLTQSVFSLPLKHSSVPKPFRFRNSRKNILERKPLLSPPSQKNVHSCWLQFLRKAPCASILYLNLNSPEHAKRRYRLSSYLSSVYKGNLSDISCGFHHHEKYMRKHFTMRCVCVSRAHTEMSQPSYILL